MRSRKSTTPSVVSELAAEAQPASVLDRARTPVARVALSELGDVRTGQVFRGRIPHDAEGALRVLQIRDLRGPASMHGAEPLRVASQPALEEKRLQPGDILMPSRGDFRQAVVFDSDKPTIASHQLLTVRLENTAALPDYVAWALNEPASQHALDIEAQGTNMPLLNRKSLLSLKIPLPAVAVQRRIIALLQLARAEAKLHRQLMDNRQRQLTGMVHQLMSQDL